MFLRLCWRAPSVLVRALGLLCLNAQGYAVRLNANMDIRTYEQTKE